MNNFESIHVFSALLWLIANNQSLVEPLEPQSLVVRFLQGRAELSIGVERKSRLQRAKKVVRQVLLGKFYGWYCSSATTFYSNAELCSTVDRFDQHLSVMK